MKSFFAATDKENAQQAGYLFLIVNILGFVTTGIMGMEAPPGELLVNFLWGLSLAGVILTMKPLLGILNQKKLKMMICNLNTITQFYTRTKKF